MRDSGKPQEEQPEVVQAKLRKFQRQTSDHPSPTSTGDRDEFSRSDIFVSGKCIEGGASVPDSPGVPLRYRTLIDALPHVVWIAARDGNIVYQNQAWERLAGPSSAALPWLERLHPRDRERVSREWNAAIAAGTPFRCEAAIVTAGEEGRVIEVVAKPILDGGEACHWVGVLTDITERKAAEERLRHCAMHDALTGLPNRAFFLERLEQVAAHHRRDPGAHFAVLFLDLDRFKILNDSLGHSAGDLLLQELAKRLRRSLRQEDTLARIGGDEFTILLERIKGIRDPVRVAKRIHRALARPFQIEGEEVFTSASIGIALSSSGYREAQELLRNADTAMYRAKERGQGQHVVFNAEMHERALSSLKLESALRQAVERREFLNYYQPIISLESGRIVGFEALLRWPRPQGGMIEPLEFIPIAEETGLMVDICLWSCEEACRQIRAWQKAFPFPLSIHVNISGSNFAQPDFIDRLDRILAKTKLDPTTLKLEITESVIMKNAASLNEMLERIKARKINLHLDDFGTGYSSLSYLHRFPIDALKIDRSFIGALLENAKNLAIVQTILTLARSLDLEVIAEGVETEAQLEEIRRMSCGYAQGYFFARPLAAEDAAHLLAAMR